MMPSVSAWWSAYCAARAACCVQRGLDKVNLEDMCDFFGTPFDADNADNLDAIDTAAQ